MAADADPAGDKKPAVLKVPATTSSFINKSNTRFAPKAVARRRRPAGTANTQKATETTASPPPTADRPTEPPVVRISEARTPAENIEGHQAALPTPAATQETTGAGNLAAAVNSIRPSSVRPEVEQATEIDQRSSAHDSASQLSLGAEEPSAVLSEVTIRRPTALGEDGTRAKFPKRIHVQSPAPTTESQEQSGSAPVEADDVDESNQQAATRVEPGTTHDGEVTGTDAASRNDAAKKSQPTTRSKRKRLPWVAVNQPTEEVEHDVDATIVTEPSANARGKRKAQPAADEGEKGADISARMIRRGRKRQADALEDGGEDGSEKANADQPAKRTRKSRKKEQELVLSNEQENHESGEALETGVTGAAQPKPNPRTNRRTPKHKRSPTANEAGVNGVLSSVEDSEAVLKRRGRQRATTPPNAEDYQIADDDTFMDDLAAHNRRVGKISEREKKMREIDWVEVKKRRKEEHLRMILEKQKDRTGLDPTVTAGTTQSRPQFQEINGEIVLIQGSGTIDRQRDADALIEEYDVVEEDDLTQRINMQSFIHRNKRNPAEFMTKRQWTAEGIDQFYDALTMFGTDFQIISTMFPGTTRRSIKLRFNKEERNNPERIKAALAGTRTTEWHAYLKAAERKEEDFADVDRIKAEMEEEARKMQEQIEEAKAAYEEELRQKKLAGVDVEEGGDSKENKKGKKANGKEKMGTITEEEGVEIVEDDYQYEKQY